MKETMRLLAIATGLVLLATSAVAQEAAGPDQAEHHARKGIWFSLGAGLGSRGISCEFCVGVPREEGFSTSFRVGGVVSPTVTLGAALTGWITKLSEPLGGSYSVFSALMGVVQVYPSRLAGFFVQGGGGYIVDVLDDETVIDSPGLTLGLGYDIRVGRNFSLTPHINYLRTLDGGVYNSDLYQFGVAATWH